VTVTVPEVSVVPRSIRAPPPRIVTRKRVPSRRPAPELPPMGLPRGVRIRLPERVTWDGKRFLAKPPGEKQKAKPFLVDESGARLALARAFLHAGYGQVLRQAPWDVVCRCQSWCDRHEPGLMSELRPEKQWKKFHGWLRRWRDGDRDGAAVIAGRPGSGKTCGACVVARLSGRFPLELDLEEQEGQKFVENLLKKQQEVRHATTGRSGKVVLLDVPDEPSQALKERLALVAENSPDPVVFICSDDCMEQLGPSMRKHCGFWHKISAELEQVTHVLKEILRQEGVGEMPECCEAIAEACHGDMRCAITRAQLLSVAASGSEHEGALPLAALLPTTACSRLLGAGAAVGVEGLCELLALDATVPALFQENHTGAWDGLPESEALDGCAETASALALADVAASMAEATAWGGTDESQAAVEGFLLAAVGAGPRRCAYESGQRTFATRPVHKDLPQPAITAAIATKLSTQLCLPKAYVQDRAVEWLLEKPRLANSTNPQRLFKQWLSRQPLAQLRRSCSELEGGGTDDIAGDRGEVEEERLSEADGVDGGDDAELKGKDREDDDDNDEDDAERPSEDQGEDMEIDGVGVGEVCLAPKLSEGGLPREGEAEPIAAGEYMEEELEEDMVEEARQKLEAKPEKTLQQEEMDQDDEKCEQQEDEEDAAEAKHDAQEKDGAEEEGGEKKREGEQEEDTTEEKEKEEREGEGERQEDEKVAEEEDAEDGGEKAEGEEQVLEENKEKHPEEKEEEQEGKIAGDRGEENDLYDNEDKHNKQTAEVMEEEEEVKEQEESEVKQQQEEENGVEETPEEKEKENDEETEMEKEGVRIDAPVVEAEVVAAEAEMDVDEEKGKEPASGPEAEAETLEDVDGQTEELKDEQDLREPAQQVEMV